MKIFNSSFARSCTLKAFKLDNADGHLIRINDSYFGDRCYISSGGGLVIDGCNFAPECFIGTYKHVMKPKTKFKDNKDDHYCIELTKSWFGQKAAIFGNIKIGDYCLIGACSVVTKSIPSNSMAVGNPAKVIKKFNYETCEWERLNAVI